MCVCAHINKHVYVCMYVYVYVCVYVYVYVYICLKCTYIYIFTYSAVSSSSGQDHLNVFWAAGLAEIYRKGSCGELISHGLGPH